MADENNNEKLREKIRLAEKRLSEQYENIDSMHRKAALLGALCVAVIGYLLTHDTEFVCKSATDRHCHFWAVILFAITKVISPSILAYGVALCWKVLYPAKYRAGGGLWDDDLHDENLTDFLKRLLETQRSAVWENQTIISEKKTAILKDAATWAQVGMAISFVSVVLGEIVAFVIADC